MAWSVQEGDFTPIDRHLISASALRNPTRFAASHISFANPIEQRRFAMVDMPEHCHYWWPLHEIFFMLTTDNLADGRAFCLMFRHEVCFCNLFNDVIPLWPFNGHIELFAQDHCRIMIDIVCNRSHDAILHQDFDQINRASFHQNC